jgi:hypothetical protein
MVAFLSELRRNLKEQTFWGKLKSKLSFKNIKDYVTDKENILIVCIIAFSFFILCGFGIFICCCKTKVSDEDLSDECSVEEAPME